MKHILCSDFPWQVFWLQCQKRSTHGSWSLLNKVYLMSALCCDFSLSLWHGGPCWHSNAFFGVGVDWIPIVRHNKHQHVVITQVHVYTVRSNCSVFSSMPHALWFPQKLVQPLGLLPAPPFRNLKHISPVWCHRGHWYLTDTTRRRLTTSTARCLLSSQWPPYLCHLPQTHGRSNKAYRGVFAGGCKQRAKRVLFFSHTLEGLFSLKLIEHSCSTVVMH